LHVKITGGEEKKGMARRLRPAAMDDGRGDGKGGEGKGRERVVKKSKTFGEEGKEDEVGKIKICK